MRAWHDCQTLTKRANKYLALRLGLSRIRFSLLINSPTFLVYKLSSISSSVSFQVRSVMVESCLNLLIGLDLTGVNPTKIPFKFKNCGRVSFDFINFDPRFSGSQLLSIDFETVNSVIIEGLAVEEAVQVSISSDASWHACKN